MFYLIRCLKNVLTYALKPKFTTDITTTAVNKYLKCFNPKISTHSTTGSLHITACIRLKCSVLSTMKPSKSDSESEANRFSMNES